jgi:hypothetical protein
MDRPDDECPIQNLGAVSDTNAIIEDAIIEDAFIADVSSDEEIIEDAFDLTPRSRWRKRCVWAVLLIGIPSLIVVFLIARSKDIQWAALQMDPDITKSMEATFLSLPKAKVSASKTTDVKDFFPFVSDVNGIPVWAGRYSTEPFDVRAFLTARAPPTDNAATVYEQAFAAIDPTIDHVYSPDQRASRIAEVTEFQRLLDVPWGIDNLRSGKISLTEVDQILSGAKPALDKMEEAQTRPSCIFYSQLYLDQLPIHLATYDRIYHINTLEVFRAGKRGDFPTAHRSLARLLRFSRDLRPRGCILTQAVAVRIGGGVIDFISNFTLSQQGLTKDDCDLLITLLIDHQKQRLDSMEEGLRMDYIQSRNMLHVLQMKRPNQEKFVKLVELLGDERDVSRLKLEDFTKINWEAEIASLDSEYSFMLEQCGKTKPDMIVGLLPNPKLLELNPKSSVLTDVLKDATYGSCIRSWREKTRWSGIIDLVAVRRYQLLHHRLPPNLASAVADAGISIPLTDWFTGGSLSYVVIDGKPVVYSIGMDGIDQGGKVDWDSATKPGDMILTIKE